MSDRLTLLVRNARRATASAQPLFVPRHAMSSHRDEYDDAPAVEVPAHAPSHEMAEIDAPPGPIRASRRKSEDLETGDAPTSAEAPEAASPVAIDVPAHAHRPAGPRPPGAAPVARVAVQRVEAVKAPARDPESIERTVQPTTGAARRARRAPQVFASSDALETPASPAAELSSPRSDLHPAARSREEASPSADSATRARPPAKAQEAHEPAAARDLGAPADGLPDITISIEHIEVRAASLAAPRPRREFRPAVTLNDFLRRRSDPRS
ncbi:MAG TPA: hypothetical protein VK762_28900 [Polyangiaceae bacterium]|jgi:hypothetical protein|nr:hypothetical protein [Polyangiaceae bacterium]